MSSRTQPGSGLAARMAGWLTRQGVARMAPFGPGLALWRCQPGGQRGGKRAALREQSGDRASAGLTCISRPVSYLIDHEFRVSIWHCVQISRHSLASCD